MSPWFFFRVSERKAERGGLAAALLLASCALLAGCGDSDASTGTVVSEGSGIANHAPLWPILTGLEWGAYSTPVYAATERRGDEVWFSVDLAAFDSEILWAGSRTLDLVRTSGGDVRLREADGRQVLLVPETVRVGMRWEVDHDLDRREFVFSSESDNEVGDGRWVFEVTARQEVEGLWGPRVVWTIDAAGPPVPHTRDSGNRRRVLRYDRDAISGESVPLSVVPRWGVTFRFVEGVGPLQLPYGLRGARLGDAGPRTLAGIPAEGVPVGDPGQDEIPPLALRDVPPVPELLGDALEELATIPLTRLADEPLRIDTISRWFPATARYTAAPAEVAAGAAAELVLFGHAVVEGGTLDPDGQLIADVSAVGAAVCVALDPSSWTPTDLGQLAGTCPDRAVAGNAHPWVTGAGDLWQRIDAHRVSPEIRDPAEGTLRVTAQPVEAPFERNGVLYALSCGQRARGAAALESCALVALPSRDANLISVSSAHEQPTEAFRVFRQSTVPVPLPGDGTRDRYAADQSSAGSSALPSAELPVAVPFDDAVAYIAVDASDGHGGAPRAGVVWLSLAGDVLRREIVHLNRPAVSQFGRGASITDVTTLGELRVVTVERDGLRVERRGRLEIPAGHVALHAVEVAPGRFLVATETPGGPDEGRPVRRPYDSNLSVFGVRPAVEDGSRLHLFLATAATSGSVDPTWLRRRVTATAAPSSVRVCEPPLSATVLDQAPRVTEVRIGPRSIDASLIERDAAGCMFIAVTPDEVALTEAAGRTPVALQLDGQSWVSRVLPPLPRTAPSLGDQLWAPLPDGGRRTLDRVISPLGVEAWPTSLRVAALDVDCTRSATVDIAMCRDHLSAGGFDSATWSRAGVQDRLRADRAGGGLWAQLGSSFHSWSEGGVVPNLGLALCPESDVCLDALALPSPPPGYEVGHMPTVALDRAVRAPVWGPTALHEPAPTGGVLSSTHHFASDGTVTPLAVTGSHEILVLPHFDAVVGDWVDDPGVLFQWGDGTACGWRGVRVDGGVRRGQVCLTRDGLIEAPPLPWGEPGVFAVSDWIPVEPRQLATVSAYPGTWQPGEVLGTPQRILHVNLYDVDTNQVTSIPVGPLLPAGISPSVPDTDPLGAEGEAHVPPPVFGADGSVWWTAGPPLSTWVRASGDGELAHGPLPDPDAAVWSATGDRVYWTSGRITTVAELIAAGQCVPSEERCNGADDDCDGVIDEAPPVGALCDASHGDVSCQRGACVVASCAAGFDDCDGLSASGCEAELATPAHCLRCGDACPAYGGSVCEAAGCTQVAITKLVVTSNATHVLFAGQTLLSGDTWRAGVRDVAAGPYHLCVLDAAGRVTCEAAVADCSGDACAGAAWPALLASLPDLDAVWAGDRSTCGRAAGDGATFCWGRVGGPPTGEAVRVDGVTGAESIVFGGLWPDQACALVAGAVACFGPANGSGPFTVSALAELAGVSSVHGGPGWFVFEASGAHYAVGSLWRYVALGGPPERANWATPTRAPGLDSADTLVDGFQLPCKHVGATLWCPFEAGVPWNSALNFDGPARSDDATGWVQIPTEARYLAGSNGRLCRVRDDIAGTVECRP